MNTNYSIQNQFKDWWMPALGGAILVFLSLFMLFSPKFTFIGLSILFGWYIFISGGFNLAFGIRSRKFFQGSIWYTIFGLIEMTIGTILLFKPALAAETLILFLGVWLAFMGTSRMSFSFVLKKMEIRNWWWTFIGGLLTLLLSIYVIINPIVGVITTVYLVSLSILIIGILSMGFGWQLKKLNIEIINQ